MRKMEEQKKGEKNDLCLKRATNKQADKNIVNRYQQQNQYKYSENYSEQTRYYCVCILSLHCHYCVCILSLHCRTHSNDNEGTRCTHSNDNEGTRCTHSNDNEGQEAYTVMHKLC